MPLTRTRELFKLQQTWYFGENTANKVDLVIKGLKNEIKRPKKIYAAYDWTWWIAHVSYANKESRKISKISAVCHWICAQKNGLRQKYYTK